jgi:hypothetical protein
MVLQRDVQFMGLILNFFLQYSERFTNTVAPLIEYCIFPRKDHLANILRKQTDALQMYGTSTLYLHGGQ